MSRPALWLINGAVCLMKSYHHSVPQNSFLRDTHFILLFCLQDCFAQCTQLAGAKCLKLPLQCRVQRKNIGQKCLEECSQYILFFPSQKHQVLEVSIYKTEMKHFHFLIVVFHGQQWSKLHLSVQPRKNDVSS